MVRETVFYYLLCDACKRAFRPVREYTSFMDEYFFSREVMLAEAAKAGWGYEVMVHGNVTFYCPECKKKLEDKKGEEA